MERKGQVNESDFRRAIALCPNCTALFKTNVHIQYKNVRGLKFMAMPEIYGTIICPICKYPVESTKNSMYDFVEDTFKYLKSLGQPELIFLRDAIISFKESAKTENDQHELKDKVFKVAPKLFTFDSFIPKNSGEWAGWLSLVTTIVFGILGYLQNNQTTNTIVILNNVGNTEVVVPKVIPDTSRRVVGRNDSCPCGSSKKFKNCHGK
ncbi:SEC-C motif-containing protein [Sphingobacterium alimentarium]|uniref:SEC-C motif-containing protein n=1 Tax=Sphingobacterium alimentarium TaxID=797292 RepID=A0A4R3W105_9SPHI|nr:SEC-C metal-binding domain-containing protein [Sphingobacterium alimentarium]TCV17151.1 SEC-C motif-containing protein [Sphingobacterium alimentarium]